LLFLKAKQDTRQVSQHIKRKEERQMNEQEAHQIQTLLDKEKAEFILTAIATHSHQKNRSKFNSEAELLDYIHSLCADYAPDKILNKQK
jgi:hypothetical protein